MSGRLRPYEALDAVQQDVIDDLYAHDERLALLDTGFGKSVCALTAGQELIEAGVVTNPLVLAPLRVAQSVWPNEPGEWQHLRHVRMVCWGGPPEDWEPSPWRESRLLHGQRTHAEQRLPGIEDVRERRRLEERIGVLKAAERRVNRQVLAARPEPGVWHVTSFENIAWLTDLYAPGESPFDLWIVDETGRVARNPKSPRYKALRKHMPLAAMRWGLNATPAPEGAEDLFGQVALVAGSHIWGKSFYQWRQKYFVPVDYMGYSYRLQIGAFDLLMKDLNAIAFRVPAEALAYQKTIRHSQIEVDLPPKAREAYDDMAKRMAVAIDGELAEGGASSGEVVAMSEGSASAKLRQITQGYLYETDGKGRRIVHHIHDEKAHALADLIDSMGREPLLVAYQFDEDLEIIRRIWKNVPYLGQGLSASTAAENIERWNRRELPVMAIHPNSASHGLNLQYGGHHICWLALPWGLDPYVQTNQRIDRRGQAHACFGHHIVATGTIDSRVSDVLLEKDAEQNKIIQAIKSVV